MANYSSIILAVFSLLLSVVLLHAASPNDVVSTICQRTRNPPFCFNVLKSSATTDLKALTTFTLNLAHTKATDSRLLALSLASKVVDPNLKARYTACAGQYDDAASDMDDAKTNFASGDYDGVNLQASGAMMEADDCLENLTKQPVDSSRLSNNAKALEDVCSIILVVSNLLLGQ